MYSRYYRCPCGCELVQTGYPDSLGYPGLHRYYFQRHGNSLLSEPSSGHMPRTPTANIVYPRNLHVQADANHPSPEHHDTGRPAEHDPVDALHLRGGGRKPSTATAAQRTLERWVPHTTPRFPRVQHIDPSHPPPQRIARERDNTHGTGDQARSVNSERDPAASSNDGDTEIAAGNHETTQEPFSSAYNRDHADSTAPHDNTPHADSSRSVPPATNQTQEAGNYNEPLNTFIVLGIPVARAPRHLYVESAQERGDPSTDNGNQTGEYERPRVVESPTQRPFRQLQTTIPASDSDSTEYLSDEAVRATRERHRRRLQLRRGALRHDPDHEPERDVNPSGEDEEENRGRPQTRIISDAARKQHRRCERETGEENRRGRTRYRQGEEHLGSPSPSSSSPIHRAIQSMTESQRKDLLHEIIDHLKHDNASEEH